MPSKTFDDAIPVINKLTSYCVQCPWLPINGFSIISIYYKILFICLVITIQNIKTATPWFDLPIKYDLCWWMPSNAWVKFEASIVIIRKFETYNFVPEKDFGGRARNILSDDLHLYNMFAIAATRQF